MREWWKENNVELFAGVFLVAIGLFATVVLLHEIDKQAAQQSVVAHVQR